MEDLSPKAKAAWEHVCAQYAPFYEAADPEGYRELVDRGVMEEVKEGRSRPAFKMTWPGLHMMDYERLMERLRVRNNFMPKDAVDAIHHILVRLGPPV